MVRRVFVTVLVLHGVLHFMGFARAFGMAELPQLSQPISRGLGAVWLTAGLAFLLTAGLFVASSRVWWAVAFAAVVLSQIAILASWGDAWAGTIANAVILAGAVYGLASDGPPGFAAEYEREVRRRLAAAPASLPLLAESDLSSLPAPVRRYLRLAGAVGRPRVHHFEAAWRGRIRSAADDPWMDFEAVQFNFPDEPSRFFLMRARKSGLPVDVLHAFQDESASMRVRMLSLFPIVEARGADPTRAETVTLLNDLCLLAPGALVRPEVSWGAVEDRRVNVRYTVGANTISAVLHFDERGELTNFVSEDRLAASPDGRGFTRLRWSTPVGEYRDFGPWRVATRGEGRWHPPEGEYAYIELELLDLNINGAAVKELRRTDAARSPPA